MTRVFVTGGAGFLGRAVVRDLLVRGVHVRCLVRGAEQGEALLDAVTGNGGPAAARLDVVFGSLRDERVDPRWLFGCDRVIHAAAAMRGAPSILVRQNVTATRALVDAAIAASLRRFVLVSSLSVYAPHALRRRAILDETCPIEPTAVRRGAYVYSKVVQEEVCWDARLVRGLPLVAVRPGVIYGPGRSCVSDRVGPRLGHVLALIDGDRPLPYTFVTNCASAVVAALLTPGVEGAAFNVVDDELPTARQIVDADRRAGGDFCLVRVPGWAVTPLSRMYEWGRSRSDDMLPAAFLPYVVDATYKRLRFSNALAKSRLNWRPSVDLPSAFRQTMAGAHASAVPQ